ncbi:MAG: hypothetical protein J6S85_07150 [Methanobrevibacter sp.]|nr:hypothetical protein [Methanobrevibacter sp.]
MEFANVKAFAEMSKDLSEAMSAYAHNYNLQRKGLKAFADHSEEEQKKLINKAFAMEVAKQSGMELPDLNNKTEVRRYAMNPMVRFFANQIQDVMIDMILPETLMTGSLKYFADMKFADLGDTIKFDIKSNSLFTVSKAGNRQRTTNQQKTFRTTVTMAGVNHEITVGTTLFEILTGQAYLAEEVMKVARSIETAMLFDAYDAFTTEMNGLTGNLAVANYSEESLITLLETVTAYNQGRKAVVIGTPLALKAVLPTNTNYRYLLDDEYVKLGHLQTFNGYDVLPMEQVANPYNSTAYSLKLDDTKLYVVSPASDKIVKIGVFGGTFSHQDNSYDNANKTIENTTEKSWETAVVTNSVGGVIKALS